MNTIYEVVSAFIQSGVYVKIGTILEVTHVSNGGQNACQFPEGYLNHSAAHTCSGYCAEGRGLWVYKYFLKDNCIPYSENPSWEL